MNATPAAEVSRGATESDLRWWLDLAPQLDWIWAKTYAESAPHDYVVLGRTAGTSRVDFVRAGAVIRTFGQPGKFYRSTNIYLEASGWKWWTMDRRVRDTDLINRATTDRSYGHQDAPSTATGVFTAWDSIAADYDLRRDPSNDAEVRARISNHFGSYSPRTLDVGSGAGALLDLGVVAANRCTSVDCSQGMLNELVLKHPDVGRIIPARFEDVPDSALDGPFDLVVAMDVPGIDVRRLHQRSRGPVIVTEGYAARRPNADSSPMRSPGASDVEARQPTVR